MNAKKKNKKGNKPPNPSPPQNLENIPKPEEIIEEKPKCEVKEENILKPEIASEVVQLPVSDVEKIESESPQKPKRNKGKKNKLGKNDETVLDRPQEKQNDPFAKIEETKQDIITEEIKVEEKKDLLDEASVVPSARKKKNKKKGQEKVSEDPIIAEKDPELTIVEPVIGPIEEIDSEIQELVSSKPETPKQDSKKKKNKKKNRTDSEKSDKSDNALSCTTAFQKLMGEDDTPKQEQKDIKIECSQECSNFPLEKSCIFKPSDEVKEIKDIIEPKDIKEPIKDESKGKKKNKKDKKLHQRELEEMSVPEIPQVMPTIEDVQSQDTISDETNKDILQIMEKTTDLEAEKEPISKPKAKIAKPVEKKRKGKQDVQSADLSNVEGSETMKEDHTEADLVKKPEITLENIPGVDINELKVIDPAPVLSEIPQQTDKINVPAETFMGKKRKKSPKPPKNRDSKNIAEVIDFPHLIQPEIIHEIKQSVMTGTSDAIQPDNSIFCKNPEEIKQNIPETSPEVTSKTKEEPKVDEIGLNIERSLTPDIKKDNDGFETKTSKKKKKIPKVPIQCEVLTESKEQIKTEIKKSEDNTKIPKDLIEKNVEVPLDISFSAGSEVRIVGTEDSASSCDATPDVSFVRSSSQQFLDNNNNTVIRELINLEEIKTNDPLLLPLIEGSGETPIRTPERVTSEIKTTELEPFKLTEEKTDIKSKMIEVNQDMEELRMSIERSLAEFTSLEKCEHEAEKKYDTQMELKKEKSLTLERQKSPSINILLEGELSSKDKLQKEKSPFKETLQKDKSPNKDSLCIEKSSSKNILAKEKSPSRDTLKKEKSPLKSLDKEKSTSKKEKKQELTLKKEKSPLKDIEVKDIKVEEAISVHESVQNIPIELRAKESENTSPMPSAELQSSDTPPVYPARKDNKGKNKSKKKGRQENTQAIATATSDSTTSQSKDNTKVEEKEKTDQKSEQKTESSQEKGKQQTSTATDDSEIERQPMNADLIPDTKEKNEFDPIDDFEDALTSSIDDVNKTFEMIAKSVNDDNVEFQKKLAANKPEINITEAAEDTDRNKIKANDKVNPVSQPKNLLGQTDIPVRSNRIDYKKEKNKTPNARQARVKIKDSVDIENKKQSKESQTENVKSRKNSDKSVKESYSRVQNDNEEYVYKYSFRKVFLQSACHVCNKDLNQVRVPCGFCNLIFYCGMKHKDEDWPQHQALCFAVSTIAHMKDQKHIYSDAQNATGQEYRLLRMQTIVSCEKVLKRRLVPWEQEVLLYPRICADVACREWRQVKLKDCDGCQQLSYCADHPDHLPKTHARWCKSYSLYQKLVSYQQTLGRLEPKLPTKVMEKCEIPAKMNEVLASMYEEKIDMNDIQYAALTQLATAPLTAAYCLQLCRKFSGHTNGMHKKHSFTIHVVGAELQFEADALNKWETFFLHLRPDVEELKVVLVSPMLNPGNLPLELLGKIKLCGNCYENKRRVVFKFEDNKNYFEYRTSEGFINPDIICAFNPSIQRSSIYNGKDPWPSTINSILKLKQPFIITSYTLNELRKDIARIKQVAEIDFKLISEVGLNSFASVRPDRNFISDDEMPLLFKNYCVAVILGC